ncbi:MAG TPA: CARDB domain-containing protein [Candidatus Thalassarchaeaceae archaeon]|nr:CARDB domain-containing protein [Candidatus Thalassarchaeaceae archaeon]
MSGIVQATEARNGSLEFVNAPSSGDVIGGTQTIAVVNITGLDYVLLEVEEGSSWSVVSNMTGAPWSISWDTSTVSDGMHRLKITGHPSDGSADIVIVTTSFEVDNTAPSSLVFTVDNAEIGDGSSIANRAWFDIAESGSMVFRWNAADPNLNKAVISGVPGSGNPPSDGPGTLLYRWSWAPGDFSEGLYTITLTVYDEAGNIATRSLYLGIDRTGPVTGTPVFSVSESTWTDDSIVTVGALAAGATDNGGIGIDHYEWRVNDGEWSNFGSGATSTLPLPEGQEILSFRAVDRLGNSGLSTNHTFWADQSDPVAGGWSIPEITTMTQGQISIQLVATDTLSGIDEANTTLRYGFDNDGMGSVPDITNQWLSLGTGISANLPTGIDWSTKQGDWLGVSAIMTDVAGNQAMSPPTYVRIIPGIDFHLEDVGVDRLIVAANTGDKINVTGTVIANQAYTGSLVIRLEMAPSDRTTDTNWTVLETRTLTAGSLYDGIEVLEAFEVRILASGEYDLKISIDPDETIPEKDEGNNVEYLIVSGARPSSIGAVTSFMPALFLLIAVSGWMIWTMRSSKEK